MVGEYEAMISGSNSGRLETVPEIVDRGVGMILVRSAPGAGLADRQSDDLAKALSCLQKQSRVQWKAGRRYKMGAIYRFGNFSVDPVNQTLAQGEASTTLRPKQFAVLEYLLKNAGRLVTKDELLDAAWPDVAVGDGVLKVCIAELRRLLDDNSSPPAYIETVHRRGYKFIAGVRMEGALELDAARVPEIGRAAATKGADEGPGTVESNTSTPESTAVPIAPSSVPSRTVVRNERRSIMITAVAVLLTAVAGWLFMPPPAPKVTGSTQITHDGKELCCLVTDGPRLYFNQLISIEHDVIAQVLLNGGQTLEIPSGFRNTRIMDISPDRSQLLFAAVSPDVTTASLWTLPLTGGMARRLGSISGAPDLFASWSPDGNKLVYSKGSELWVADKNGGAAQRIANLKGVPSSAVFSPDGKRIRFTLLDLETHTFSLWEVTPDGSNLHPLLQGWQETPHECCGIWTRNGRYYLFLSFTGIEGFGDIFALRESNQLFHGKAKPVQLTFGPTRFGIGATTLDDKKLLVSGFDQRGELVRYDISKRQFVPFLGGIPATNVAFSPDRQRIAYVSLIDNTLWESRTDGSERIQLSFPPEHAALPRWSPDGLQIVYMEAALGKPWKAHIISAQGGTAEQLVPGNGTEDDPSWSPDGSRIVFSTGTVQTSGSAEIRIIDMKTRQVTSVPDSQGRFSPRWSSDGRYLAALNFAPISKKLFLFDLRTGKWTNWAEDNEGIGYPAWTPDGQYVEYMNPQKCRRVKLGSSMPEDVFDIGAFTPYFSDFGPWNDTAPDGSRMFTRDKSTEDIYALDLDLP